MTVTDDNELFDVPLPRLPKSVREVKCKIISRGKATYRRGVMKVTDERFSDKQLEDWLALYDRITANPHDRSEDEAWNLVVMVVFKKIVKELQSYRKIDIAETLKYAEEAGAACEEMKYHIEKVREKIKGETNSIPRWRVIDIIDEHLTQYLDLED